ncbi:P-loop containing nucleoside triphosphate hydrolase protein [Ramicandelaber brevisporus]|nr:P-loop containing nucleoside triphosphate hydrolase protein [Ramicandelaber brevisporus]
MAIYSAWGVAQGLTNYAFMVALAHAVLLASKRLHQSTLASVLSARIPTFFDVTSAGRILSRFSRDVDSMDNVVVDILRLLLTQGVTAFATLIMISVVFPVFLVPLVPIMAAYYVAAAMYYRPTSRELKRLDSISRAPLLAHLSETLSGLPTIRAFGDASQHNLFMSRCRELMNANNQAYYLSIVVQRWMQLRMEVLANLVGLFVALFAVIARFSVDPGLVGLVLGYASAVTAAFSAFVRFWAELENSMNSAERLDHYINNIDHEDAHHKHLSISVGSSLSFASGYPQQSVKDSASTLSFEHVYMRYRPGLPLALRDVSFSIKPGQRVGLVGASGSGKSSILASLVRFCEIDGGSICINGVDIRTLPLQVVRSSVAIIPQNPTLFRGTLRFNLDPSGTIPDCELWQALERVGLHLAVSQGFNSNTNHVDIEPSAGGDHSRNRGRGLDLEIASDGSGLSAGQLQLLCLARAILSKARILVLDEATSAMDPHSDAKIQQVIRSEFAQCTILTIAHRVSTIMDYDRVFLMNDGRLCELSSGHRFRLQYSDPAALFADVAVTSATSTTSNAVVSD